ncbi:transporter substrate-binding domain-containing protein [uncultured Desulfobacter sp.]|uniref:substrate-binding periplasmic protein n=1 Tax=uncultured Desulfobacter sp. TaxID=240139 RepID=UPI002AABA7B0|nr:transporter substrate-binding domain-containing protein [uncultured Desulfobacter sp.]
MNISPKKAACFLFLIILLWASGVNAANYLFVGSNFPVLSEELPDKSLGGISIDIVRIICKRLGHTPTFEMYPWARAQALVKTGEADVLLVPFKTPERETWMDFSEIPFFEDKSFFFIRPGSHTTWDGTFESIENLHIGKVRGWSLGEAFEKEKSQLTIDYAPNLDLCFLKLISGRVDLVPTQKREAYKAFQRLGLRENEYPTVILPELSVNYCYYGFSKQKQAVLKVFKAEFDQALIQMKKSGEIARLMKTYPPYY